MKAALSGRTRLAVLTLVVLAAAAAGIAYAAIPDAGGVVHGCYAKRDGTLRVIDTEQGGSCNASKETTLDWNRTGPQGPAGPQGATGPQGPAGPRGPGASTVQVNAPVGQETVLTTLPDGIELRGNCFSSVIDVAAYAPLQNPDNVVEWVGTATDFPASATVRPTNGVFGFAEGLGQSDNWISVHGMIRVASSAGGGASGGAYTELQITGSRTNGAGDCAFSGILIPSTLD